MSKAQTENSYLADKMWLRINNSNIEDGTKVLDGYHAQGSIWKNIEKITGKKIKVTKIDIEDKDDENFVIIGDNRKVIKSLNLKKYDILDLDAFGFPYENLIECFNQKYKGVVFVTFIQSMAGALNHKMLLELGYTKKMINKCPTLFYKNGIEKVKKWLSLHGVEKITIRSKGKKHYFAVNLT